MVKNYIRQHDSECNTCMRNVGSNSHLDEKITVEEVIKGILQYYCQMVNHPVKMVY